jgi:hypothetical protein
MKNLLLVILKCMMTLAQEIVTTPEGKRVKLLPNGKYEEVGQVVTTENGKKVVFKNDSTWEYLNEKKEFKRFETRLLFGNTTFISENIRKEYNPVIGLSFHVAVSPKSLFGLDIQHETWNIFYAQTRDSRGNKNGEIYRKLNMVSTGMSGRTHFTKRNTLYFHYGYRFLWATSQKISDPKYGSNLKLPNYHSLTTGIGFVITRKFKISPFVEIAVNFNKEPVKNPQSFLGIQTKLGVVF